VHSQDSADLSLVDQALQRATATRQQVAVELNGISIPAKANNAEELIAAVRHFITTEHDVMSSFVPKVRAIMQDRSGTQQSRGLAIVKAAADAKRAEDAMHLRLVAAQRAFLQGTTSRFPRTLKEIWQKWRTRRERHYRKWEVSQAACPVDRECQTDLAWGACRARRRRISEGHRVVREWLAGREEPERRAELEIQVERQCHRADREPAPDQWDRA